MDCIFCRIENPVLENELALAFYDKYPVNPGHLLVIPKRHVTSWFETTAEEREAIFELLQQGREKVQERLQSDGFNIGINEGIAAGQTIFHLHVHLIPRYVGDIEEPRGGVRGVIPGRRGY